MSAEKRKLRIRRKNKNQSNRYLLQERELPGQPLLDETFHRGGREKSLTTLQKDQNSEKQPE
jgi:hypothetical protein